MKEEWKLSKTKDLAKEEEASKLDVIANDAQSSNAYNHQNEADEAHSNENPGDSISSLCKEELLRQICL